MSFNYFVAYDLMDPDQNYPGVCSVIESLGQHSRIQMSLYYLKTNLGMAEVHDRIRLAMDPNDRLAVIWARDAMISSYPPSVMRVLQGAFQAQ